MDERYMPVLYGHLHLEPPKPVTRGWGSDEEMWAELYDALNCTHAILEAMIERYVETGMNSIGEGEL
jgi:hypothetical protein